MKGTTKNWDTHVIQAEEVARGEGFRELRDRIVDLARPQGGETAVDVGAGTGLLTLALAERSVYVWAIDISPAMCDYLRMKARSARFGDVDVVVGSAVSLPIMDAAADIVVSNYCLHHLSDVDKRRALAEAYRVLRPGGRLVFGDMMFGLRLDRARDRRVVREKVAALARKGPAGLVRLTRNGLRIVGGRWEQPATAEWWREALMSAGFGDAAVRELGHEGGIATARKP